MRDADLALYEAVFRFLDFDPIQYDQMKTVHMRTGNRVEHHVGVGQAGGDECQQEPGESKHGAGL